LILLPVDLTILSMNSKPDSSHDTTPDRRGSGSIKWDLKPHPEAPDQIPLWVADMDFPAPRAVIDAIHRRADHGVFGYTMATDSYYRALDGWFTRRFGLSIPKEVVTITHGIVPAVHTAVRALTAPGDGVIIQNPVYYPFASAVTANGRELLVNDLNESGGHYSMNFPQLEELAQQAKMIILCSPHNPVGRIWRREELEQLADIALRHGLVVVSDEIHCDLVMPDSPVPHIPFPLISSEAAALSLLCTAPSKTFNIPGLATSNIIIGDSDLRRAFQEEVQRSCGDHPNVFGAVACEAAYDEGEAWLSETLDYIRGNLETLSHFLAERIPEVTISPLEATYLPWLDFRPILSRLGTGSAALERLLADKAGVWIEAGSLFGPSGEGFMRINIACARPLLLEALEKIAIVLKP
jgi:cystathionine beta-lyase